MILDRLSSGALAIPTVYWEKRQATDKKGAARAMITTEAWLEERSEERILEEIS